MNLYVLIRIKQWKLYIKHQHDTHYSLSFSASTFYSMTASYFSSKTDFCQAEKNQSGSSLNLYKQLATLRQSLLDDSLNRKSVFTRCVRKKNLLITLLFPLQFMLEKFYSHKWHLQHFYYVLSLVDFRKNLDRYTIQQVQRTTFKNWTVFLEANKKELTCDLVFWYLT